MNTFERSQLPKMSASQVIYKTLVHLNQDKGIDECVNYLQSKNPEANKKALKKSVQSVLSTYRGINKSKSRPGYTDKITTFLNTNYTFPQQYQFKARETSNDSFLIDNLETVKNISHVLARDLHASKQEHALLELENDTLKEKMHDRACKSASYKNLLIVKKQLKKKVSHLKSVVTVKNTRLKQVRAAKTYVFNRNEHLSSTVESLKRQVDSLKESLNETKKELNETLEENQYLRILVNDKEVVMYDHDVNLYSNEAQTCVYSLLNHNVTSSKVAPVIEAVLKLVNLKANRLPSVSTVNNMNIQRLILAQKQIAETLPEKENICLLSDETSKYGKKIEGFHTRDENGTLLVLGLRQLATKSGQDTLSTFQEILSDIDQVSEYAENLTSKRILLNIVSTMSDKAATQQKFNTLLEEYRQLILMDELGQAWLDMSIAEQMSLSRLNNFFCGLHALVHMAEAASSCLVKVEKGFFDEPPIREPSFRKTNESGTARLVRTACKAFSCGGDEKCGVYGPFNIFVKDFLKENNMRSSPIERFHGNRFNVLFANAASIYFMKDKLREYLDGDDSNRLLKSVKHDLDVPEYVAGLKALGLISYLITMPLWCFIEDTTVHIMDSAAYFQEIITFVTEAVQSPEFLEGKLILSFCNKHLLSDEIFRKLTEPSEYDDKVTAILKTVLPGICETMKKLFTDFLDDGQWTIATDAKRQCTRAVPKNNKFSETVFGYVDRILREKPNISVIAQEAYVMFCHNKTLQWLEGKPDKEKEKLFGEARKNVKSVRLLFQQRRREIENKRKQILIEKFQASEQKELRRIEKLEKCTNDILSWGLWQSEDDVDNHILIYSTKRDKVAALKAQLAFRNKVLHQSPKDDSLKTVYAVTKKVGDRRVDLSVEELTLSVKSLVRHALTVPLDNHDDGPVLVGRDIEMKFDTDNGSDWFNGHVISKVPGYSHWFNIKFMNDRAIYTYELLKDYGKGDVRILV